VDRDDERLRQQVRKQLRRPAPSNHQHQGGGNNPPPPDQPGAGRPKFPTVKLASELRADPEGVPWLWDGCLARGAITLFSSLWKAGKTTLLAHLLKVLEHGGDFCQRRAGPARVLYITEEAEARWAARRAALGLSDHIAFVVRPFLYKPGRADWFAFLEHLAALLKERPADLIVFDTLSNLWPVRDENDAAQVQEALMPLHQLTGNAGLLLAHHLRKGDGPEATAARGSGALPAFVDIILELRRHSPGDRQDRRRVLTGYGRWDDVPAELVLELRDDGSGYVGLGDKQQLARRELSATIYELLPVEAPGWTAEEVRGNWPTEHAPQKQKLLDALREGQERGDWHRQGQGQKGDPYRYWTDPKPQETGFGSGSGPI
jgi:hypothetical protein